MAPMPCVMKKVLRKETRPRIVFAARVASRRLATMLSSSPIEIVGCTRSAFRRRHAQRSASPPRRKLSMRSSDSDGMTTACTSTASVRAGDMLLLLLLGDVTNN